MPPLVSIVMPAYNAGKYISQAIESVIQQSFTRWELIIVDDCSTDQTFTIATEYSNKDQRIKTFRLDQNSGCAYIPRKEAIQMATTNWIVNLDADDFIDSNDLEILYNKAIDSGADIVLHRLIRVDINGNIERSVEPCPKWNFDLQRILTGKEACMLTIKEWNINGNGLFKKSLFEAIWKEQNSNSFIGMNTDELLTRQLFLEANRVALCNAQYFYRMNPQSISSSFSLKLFHILQTNQQLKKLLISKIGLNETNASLMEAQIWEGVLSSSIRLKMFEKELSPSQKREIVQNIYQSWHNIDWNTLKRHISQIQYILFHKSFKLFMIIISTWVYVKKFK